MIWDNTLPRWAPLLPAKLRFRHMLAAHHGGRTTGRFVPVPEEPPPDLRRAPLRIHFWTPNPWPSTAIHVDRVVPELRRQVAALGLPWQIDAGGLPTAPVDWLLCLKAVPPRGLCSPHRTVLLQPDDADRVWANLDRFAHVVSVSSPVFASFLGTAHSRTWFIEETETVDLIESGGAALDAAAPSQRPPLLLWHGTRESLDGLVALKDALASLGRDTNAELVILTNLPERSERWGALPVRYAAWSPKALCALAAQARLGIVPARPSVPDSYLKSAGRMRGLFARGCPAIGDARSPDVVAFSEICGMPSAQTADQWRDAIRQIWNDDVRLDRIARQGHAQMRAHYNTARTAAQWLWFLGGGAEGPDRHGSTHSAALPRDRT
ncbi:MULTISPECIES: glycosyltransferase [unclassified Bradyrhizobium]|uniref:glycosyltransferase n=1 Tax=unclassified Bradyrhizobium TaxID=2631580 RepID=UPI0028E25EA6|nr:MULTISPECIES: glycosyltransferase [unclassified Bradyrhizobium]